MRLGLGHSEPDADAIALANGVAEPVTDADPDSARLP